MWLMLLYLVVEVGPIEGGGEGGGVWNAKDLLAVLHDTAGGRGRQAQQGRFGKLPLQDAQKLVVWRGKESARTQSIAAHSLLQLDVI